jgi:hypothetical protein
MKRFLIVGGVSFVVDGGGKGRKYTVVHYLCLGLER